MLPASACPRAVEAAAYFVVAEALTNVAKLRAGRARAVTRRARRTATLSSRSRDDGIGGADSDAGSGLRGLADRRRGARRHGSRSTVPPGEGTTSDAEIPCA